MAKPKKLSLMSTIEKMQSRVLSLDFFRGVTMLLLVAETTELYDVMGWAQMHHHPWHGFRFWDLIQPFFMFIAGVAMPFSLAHREAKGKGSYRGNWKHILTRCLILLALGVGIQCAYSGKLVWELWNVLAQLSVTILIAYSIIRLKIKWQLLISLALLLTTDLLYRFFPVAGFNHPFVMDANFGSWVDLLLMGKLNNGGGWVAISCIPTAAHTIWGVIAGRILLNASYPKLSKLKQMCLWGAAFLAIGYGLDFSGISPIIKRICTTSFIFVAGGWTFLALAFSYWLIDVRGWVKIVIPFSIVGMNSIFIYMLTQTAGMQWFNGFVGIFTGGAVGWLGFSEHVQAASTALVTLGLEWMLCYYLYKKRIFLKI
jgi:predicted acyltransferase